MATSLAAAASGSPTVFTCKAEDQSKDHAGVVWGVPVSTVVTVLALMVLSAVIGRWSAPRCQGKELVHDPEPWVVVSETAATSQPPPNGKERPAARVEPLAVREVASQAPCTYTIVRGCARGRFQHFPDTARG